MTTLLNKLNSTVFIDKLTNLEKLEVIENLINNASLFERGSN
jgi:hypothetical protein